MVASTCQMLVPPSLAKTTIMHVCTSQWFGLLASTNQAFLANLCQDRATHLCTAASEPRILEVSSCKMHILCGLHIANSSLLIDRVRSCCQIPLMPTSIPRRFPNVIASDWSNEPRVIHTPSPELITALYKKRAVHATRAAEVAFSHPHRSDCPFIVSIKLLPPVF